MPAYFALNDEAAGRGGESKAGGRVGRGWRDRTIGVCYPADVGAAVTDRVKTPKLARAHGFVWIAEAKLRSSDRW